MKKIFLKPGKETPVKRFHPWVFSGAIERYEAGITSGDWVMVCDSRENALAFGHYQEGSIRIRLLHFSTSPPDANFYVNKFKNALRLRQGVNLNKYGQTNCFRLINGEGDGLSGLIIDIYGETAVVQCHSTGIHKDKQQIIKAFEELDGLTIHNIYDKSEETLYKNEGIQEKNGYWKGGLSGTGDILENGHIFNIDWEKGQKTGFFLDQRENRFLLGQLAADKEVLNCYCYTGGFSIYAIKGGAASVESVDSSALAIEQYKENLQSNGLDAEKHVSSVSDVPTFLRQQTKSYDIIVVDPPAFAKSMDKRHNAIQAYIRLNAMAMKQLKPGGILFTFSCSQVVDRNLFQNALLSASIEAGRKTSILHHLSQGPDHPSSIFHPESGYLKGLVLYVE
ncbi:MAG: class I SAM-dependent rRNA methyltransferase [Haliscomenobacter sp.]|nr:class I SAM-dependent rRNA methyltransferase [Haliscomenobacter sp.]